MQQGDNNEVLVPGQQCFVRDAKGAIQVHRGAKLATVTQQDQPVRYDVTKGRLVECALKDALTYDVTTKKGQYVILLNPAEEAESAHPTDGQEQTMPPLLLGEEEIIQGPVSFGLWPFQQTITLAGSIVGNSATSFFNNQAAQQTATGNWWGAATGPNTPGADTVGGNVDTGGFLTAPIPGCLPHVYLPLVLLNYP